MINYYDPEGLKRARYTVNLTYLFGDTKIIATEQVICNGHIYGADVINGYTEFTGDYPLSEECTFENGKIEPNLEDYELDEFNELDGEILVYNKDGEEIASCLGTQELQDHLVGVEIVKVEDLSEEE